MTEPSVPAEVKIDAGRVPSYHPQNYHNEEREKPATAAAARSSTSLNSTTPNSEFTRKGSIDESSSRSASSSAERVSNAKRRPDGPLRIPPCIQSNYRVICDLLRSGRDDQIQDTDRIIRAQAVRDTDPPVTIAKLKELSLLAIQNNSALRNDLCHDPDLFFQRVTGVKGEEKSTKARITYQCLSIELQIYVHQLRGPCAECASISESDSTTCFLTPRLEPFLRSLRDLVIMLVPEAEKKGVKRDIDVDHIAMTVRIGQSDVAKTSRWLADLLMSHCAPIRDDMCRDMHSQIAEATDRQDMDLMVKGLETLFNLLENMKLDVANHQIRTFKALLIADTVPFLRDCFGKMIQKGEINIEQSRAWFHGLQCVCEVESLDKGLARLLCGMVNMCTSPSEAFPATFRHDKDRLRNMHTDIEDAVDLQICTQTFILLLRGKCKNLKPVELASAVRDFNQKVLILIHNDDGINEGVRAHVDTIAYEMVSAIQRQDTSTGNASAALPVDPDEVYTDLLRDLRDRFADVMKNVKSDIRQRAQDYAVRFSKMDSLQISNEQRAWSTSRTSERQLLAPSMTDVGRRLAHVAIIHWQTWSELAYAQGE